jgi:hypothetical protein
MAINHRYTIICDDIRQEINGKLMLIGVYTPNISIPQVPFVLPSLAFFQCFESDRIGSFTIRMRLEQMEVGRPLVEAMGMMNIPRPGIGFAPLKLGNIPIPAFGTYTFTVSIEGERDPVISTFDIVLPPQLQQGTPQIPPGFVR